MNRQITVDIVNKIANVNVASLAGDGPKESFDSSRQLVTT